MDLQRQLIKQKNDITGASYSLGIRAKKLMCFIVSQIKVIDEDVNNIAINYKDVFGFLKLDKKTNPRIELYKLLEVLRKTPIHVLVGDSIRTTGWIVAHTMYKYTDYVTVDIDKRLKNFYIGVKENFTMYYLSDIDKIKGKNSIRIYELLLQWKRANVATYKIDEFCKMLKLPKSYFSFAKLNQKVLKVAKNEFKKINTKLNFEYEVIKKEGTKKVIAFKIIIYSQNNPTPIFSDEDKHQNEDFKSLFGAIANSKEYQRQFVESIVNSGNNALKEKFNKYGWRNSDIQETYRAFVKMKVIKILS